MYRIAAFIACFMLMMVIPITRYHHIFGIDMSKKEGEVATVSSAPDGATVVNTTELGKDVRGYAGPVPVEVSFKDGRITKIDILQNDETPEFFGAVLNAGITERYIGLTPTEAAALKCDAVSGATYSSNAVIANIRIAASYAMDESHGVMRQQPQLDYKFYLTLAIILAGCIIPLFVRNKKYRVVQLLLNVIVLGFWSGTYLCYSLMVTYMGYGLGVFVVAIPVILMLVAAFIYPIFGRPNHYCNWICPYGSLQELLGKLVPAKVRLSKTALKRMAVFRDVLWFVLMWLLWTGLWFDWMDYEPFAAFFIRSAGPVVLGIAGGFLLLSLVIQRPYCSFVCPTGTLFKLAEGRK